MKLNIPNKLIEINIQNQSGTEKFPYPNGPNDPWWNGGSSPKFFRWSLDIDVNTQFHGSHLTREPFEYNGLDIFVGDWIAKTTNGKALKIISIKSKTETTATIIVEDIFRYNTFRNENGDGSPSLGSAIVFSVTEDGLPLVDPVPNVNVGSTFLGNLQSRFESFNENNIFELEQNNHSFQIEDLVSMESGNFVKTNSNNFDKMVGSVIDVSPSPNKFLVKPFNKIFEKITPALPGSKGDIIYTDSSGNLTTSKTPKPVYLQLSNPTPTRIQGDIKNPTTAPGNELIINDVTITFSDGQLSTAITEINNQSSNTDVTANEFTFPTESESNNSEQTYGAIGAFTTSTGPKASINGTTVQFTTTTDGSDRFNNSTAASGLDFATDINNANIPGIEAEASQNNDTLIIREVDSNAINITNIEGDNNGTPWAGPSSSTGLPLNTSVSTDTALVLTRSSGNEIILENFTGTPKEDFGIESSQNGKLPIGLLIEQGVRKGEVYVVSDTSARDNLNPIVGDMALVLDSGQGEWTFYLWSGSEWKQLVDQDASDVDAKTLSVDIDFNSSSPIVIGRLSDKSRVSWVSVEVTEAWDTSNPTLTVGDNMVNDRFMSTNLNDLTNTGTYAYNPSFQYDTGGLETEVLAFIDHNGTSLTGMAKITITYT